MWKNDLKHRQKVRDDRNMWNDKYEITDEMPHMWMILGFFLQILGQYSSLCTLKKFDVQIFYIIKKRTCILKATAS